MEASPCRFAIAVHGAPYGSTAARSAIHFIEAAVALGHTVNRVFFYHDGARVADGLAVIPQDDEDLRSRWQGLSTDHGIELAVCIAAALKRGILNAEERDRYEQSAASLAPGFTIVGLGQLVEAVTDADRFMTFAA